MGLLAVVLTLFCGQRAAGQAAQPSEYERELAEAMAAHQAQRWLDALSHFAQAHALKPSARTLRGMGASAFEAGLFAQAVRDLEASLVHPERPLTPELAQAVEALLLEARPQVGIYVLRVQPEQAQLTVDDRAPLTGPRGEVLLDRGKHRVDVSHEGHVPQTLELDVHGGEREEVRLVLASIPTAQSPEPVVATLAPPVPAVRTTKPVLAPGPRRDRVSEPVQHPMVRPFAWRTSALALGSAVVVGGLYGLARVRIADIADECEQGLNNACTSEQAEQKREAKNLQRLERGMTASVIVGAASAVTATVLWVIDARARKRTARRAFTPLVVRF
jgi:hypothetical protein